MADKSSYILELERRANDLLRVYNPTDEDYIVQWDKKNGAKLFRVPAKEEVVLVRYIAKKYVKEMYQKILNDKAKKAILEENSKRVAKGMAVMDKTQKTGEQMEFEAPFYRPSQEEARKIISLLLVGLENEYGLDRAYQEEEQKSTSRDFSNVFDDVEKNRADNPTTPDVVPDIDGERDLVCDYPSCGFRAKSALGLLSHKRIHRTEEDAITA